MGDEVQRKFETLQLHAGYVRHILCRNEKTIAYTANLQTGTRSSDKCSRCSDIRYDRKPSCFAKALTATNGFLIRASLSMIPPMARGYLASKSLATSIAES